MSLLRWFGGNDEPVTLGLREGVAPQAQTDYMSALAALPEATHVATPSGVTMVYPDDYFVMTTTPTVAPNVVYYTPPSNVVYATTGAMSDAAWGVVTSTDPTPDEPWVTTVDGLLEAGWRPPAPPAEEPPPEPEPDLPERAILLRKVEA